MVFGTWTCAKYRVNGADIYVLYDSEKRIGEFQTFDEAKKQKDQNAAKT